jgi:aspartate/methionine/tyrosine aminotransferase
MSSNLRSKSSSYLEWAKLHSASKYNLATSGILGYPLAGLPVSIADLEINGADTYGYAPLTERLAKRCGVAPECVVTTNGTSMANHLAMATILDPGDEVLIEQPTYGLLLDVAAYIGANVVRFHRRVENDFQIDLDELQSKVTAKTRLIVLTNLHNPSGAFTDEATLRKVGEIASAVGARVLVDEVYLDIVPVDQFSSPYRTCALYGDHFVVTNSLTKAYGLSGIRCGWILADADLATRIRRLDDIFNGSPVFPAEQLGVIALDNLERVAARSGELLQTNRAALDVFLDRRDDIETFRPRWGTIVFPRLKRGSVDEICRLLREQFEATVVPGKFFEMPRHFRIGIGGDSTMTAEALVRLGKALDAYRSALA